MNFYHQPKQQIKEKTNRMLIETQNDRLHIPSREEFHRTYAGKVGNEDFGFNTWKIIVDAIIDDKIFDANNIQRVEKRNANFFRPEAV